MSEDERTEEVSQRESKKIAADALRRHAIKTDQDQTVRKKDGVVEKCLCRHQNETEDRTLSMLICNRVPDFVPRRVSSSMNAGRRRFVRRQRFGISDESAFDFVYDSLRLGVSSVNHQPTRAFRNPAAKEDHNQAKRSADPECDAPA